MKHLFWSVICTLCLMAGTVKSQTISNPEISSEPARYWSNLSTGLMYDGTGEYQQTIPSFHTIHGYRISNHVRIGLGTGIEIAKKRPNLPLYGVVQAQIKQTGSTPFISLKGGYVFRNLGGKINDLPTCVHEEGGLMSFLALGYQIRCTDKLAMVFSLGYRYQRLVQSDWLYIYGTDPGLVDCVYTGTWEKETAHRLEFRVGIQFN